MRKKEKGEAEAETKEKAEAKEKFLGSGRFDPDSNRNSTTRGFSLGVVSIPKSIGTQRPADLLLDVVIFNSMTITWMRDSSGVDIQAQEGRHLSS